MSEMTTLGDFFNFTILEPMHNYKKAFLVNSIFKNTKIKIWVERASIACE